MVVASEGWTEVPVPTEGWTEVADSVAEDVTLVIVVLKEKDSVEVALLSVVAEELALRADALADDVAVISWGTGFARAAEAERTAMAAKWVSCILVERKAEARWRLCMFSDLPQS